MKDLNATRTAIRVGYSKKTAYSQGQHLLKTVEVKTEIDRLLEEWIESAGLDETDWNLNPFIYRDDNYIHRKGIGDLVDAAREISAKMDRVPVFEDSQGDGDGRA